MRQLVILLLFSYSLNAQVGAYIGGVDVFKNTKGAYIEFKQVKLKAGSGISLQDSSLALSPSITINAPALANGDKGHILVSMAGTTWLLDTNSVNRYAINDTAVSFAKIVNFDAETLFGNSTGSTGSGHMIHIGDNLFFSNDTLHATGGGGGSMPDGDYGDVTLSGGSTIITINTNAVTTALINNDAVTFAKMQNLLSHHIIGRYSGTTGDPQQIVIGHGLTIGTDSIIVNESDLSIDQSNVIDLVTDLGDKLSIADSNFYYYPYNTNPRNYLTGSDTTAMSSRINQKLNASDTSSISNRIDLKLDATDTGKHKQPN